MLDNLVVVDSEVPGGVALVRFGPKGIARERVTTVGIMPTDVDGPHGLAISPDGKWYYVSTAHGAPFGYLWKLSTANDSVAGKVMLDARLTACGLWLAACERAEQARSPQALADAIATNKRDFEARLELAQTHFAAQRFTQAMDELLEIVMRDKSWNDEAARKNYVAILELMGKPAPAKAEAAAPKGTLEVAGKVAAAPSDPVVDQYRRKLSMALF